ncbi:GerAB/ArcD/ProY family transporter [Alkalihalobacillus deserti]|uniref:GerAB/ArcD/ProY family transporter n=1 Tax=Alkalihalobacillus deserti TaxID=2879466 RepID=UPI001D15C39B|nr:endospore germination permease [Alkalihalobacillus deserti]
MIEKGKISSAQMAIMMNPTIIATGLLLVPSITAAKAGRDMWISPIWGSLIGFLVVFIAFQLNKHFPKETIIEYCVHIVGHIPGKVIGFLLLFFYLHSNGIIIRQYSEFVIGNFLLQTPGIVIISSMTLVCAFAVRGGLEVIARTAQLFIPIVILLYLLIVLFLTPEVDPTNMLPVFEEGVMPSILGAASPVAWFSEFILIAFMLPYLMDREKGLKWGNLSVLSVLLLLVLTNLTALFLFGEITADLVYPFMNAGKYVEVAEFFAHLESVIMAIWVLGAFIKISVFYYVLALGTAQWLQLSEYKSLVLPLGFLIVLFAEWSVTNLIEFKHFLGTSSVFYLLFMNAILPILLLVIVLLRKKWQQKGGVQG